RAGHHDPLARHRVATPVEHVLAEVDTAVAGRPRPDERTAEGHALAGEDTGDAVLQALVRAVQIPDLPGTHADVAGGDVGVLADVAVQLHHERLAEPHHLALAVRLRVEVAAALGPAHGQAGQRVLEHLLEGEALEHALVHR